MKARIIDPRALQAITPAALSAFVRDAGWRKGEPYGKHADVYTGENRPEIILPRTDRLADYASVLSRLISILSEFGEQDELSTYNDLIGADHDLIRVRAVGANDDGSVKLDTGVELFKQAREMLLAAACATRNPQPVYRAGANRDASEYMKRVRLGQTEHGSFIVTLLAPVPLKIDHLHPSLFDGVLANYEDEPMERQVTRRLVESLTASRQAVELTHSGDGAGAFDRAVRNGVSANMCEAVSTLIEQSKRLEISVRWAKTRPTPAETRPKIEFTESDAAVLKEAARTFRAKQPRPGVTLFGTVHKLKRNQDEIEGFVTFKAEVDEKLQSISADLSQSDYSVAVRAHDKRNPVIVTGDLEHIGQRWKLINASVRELADSSEEGEETET